MAACPLITFLSAEQAAKRPMHAFTEFSSCVCVHQLFLPFPILYQLVVSTVQLCCTSCQPVKLESHVCTWCGDSEALAVAFRSCTGMRTFPLNSLPTGISCLEFSQGVMEIGFHRSLGSIDPCVDPDWMSSDPS